MNIEYQLQINAIKGEQIFYIECGELILLTDGHIGVYLKESELKIDKSKLRKPHDNSTATSYIPENLLKVRTAVIETSIARKIPSSGYAIKLYSKESGEHCFVKEKFLKMFKGYNSLFIKSARDPVLLYRYGVPYGIILPIRITPKEGEE